MSTAKDSDQQYWSNYTGLQHAKHQILTRYLGGWYPILASWSSKILYIDSHAGRGRHREGQEGSPLISLNTLLTHSSLDRILANTKISMLFLENTERHYKNLLEEIAAFGKVPAGINIETVQEDYLDALKRYLAELGNEPVFAFIDPYTFLVPMDLINSILERNTAEVFINVMFRQIDMARTHEGHEENMELVFGDDSWKEWRDESDYKKRSGGMINLYASKLNAKYVTSIKMFGKNGALKYVLFHATNNDRGRELMKETIWKVTAGTFSANERNNPAQMVLIDAKENLVPLEQLLWKRYAGKSIRTDEIKSWMIETLFLPKHLHQVLLEYRNTGIVEMNYFGKRKAFSS